MLKIRLSRVGKSHTPIFRLVVAEKSRAVKRENLEILGLYNPANKEDRFQVKKDRVLYWISKGAEPSDTARNLLCDFDVLPKKDKVNVVYGRSKKKKASATQTETQIDTDKTKSEDAVEAVAEEVSTAESTEAETTEDTSEPEVTDKIEESENNKEEATQVKDTGVATE